MKNNYSSLENLTLQKLIRAGDQEAFRIIYERYWDKIFVICNNRLPQKDIAEDLLQDIFISLWNNPKLEEVQNLEAYLFQAAKFSIIKYLNRSSRIDFVDPNSYGLLDRVGELGLDDALYTKELQQLIFQEVERLPEKTKIIFNYSRIDHLDSREIAEKLNISHRTVENQISKSLKHLRIFINNLKSLLFF